VEAGALRDAAERVLNGETVGSIIREWTRRGIKPSRSARWEESSLVKTLKSPHVAGLREWQGQRYPARWPAWSSGFRSACQRLPGHRRGAFTGTRPEGMR
jgi:hypothetical protein